MAQPTIRAARGRPSIRGDLPVGQRLPCGNLRYDRVNLLEKAVFRVCFVFHTFYNLHISGFGVLQRVQIGPQPGYVAVGEAIARHAGAFRAVNVLGVIVDKQAFLRLQAEFLAQAQEKSAGRA